MNTAEKGARSVACPSWASGKSSTALRATNKRGWAGAPPTWCASSKERWGKRRIDKYRFLWCSREYRLVRRQTPKGPTGGNTPNESSNNNNNIIIIAATDPFRRIRLKSRHAIIKPALITTSRILLSLSRFYFFRTTSTFQLQ